MSGLLGTRFENGILTVILNRAKQRNALSRALIAEIEETFASWSRRDDIALAVLTGEGDKAFCAGGDLKELMDLRGDAATREFSLTTRASLDSIRRFPVPVVALLNGDAIGGGAELAIACDLRVAAAHARIGFAQSSLAITTAWGGGNDLFRLLRFSDALHLLCTAELLTAERALQLGLINAIAPAGPDAASFMQAYVARLAQRKPHVMRAIKSLAVLQRFAASANEKAKEETERFVGTWNHGDHWAAVAEMAGGRTAPPPAR